MQIGSFWLAGWSLGADRKAITMEAYSPSVKSGRTGTCMARASLLPSVLDPDRGRAGTQMAG
jgi:hypothetical protein